MSLPHARGGVSYVIDSGLSYSESSPRTWGCFSLCPLARRSGSVFPTHVGVFPPGSGDFDTFRRLPHARGGVSVVYVRPFTAETSSPRTWGCFSSCQRATLIRRVFPTHVGVFLVDHFDSLTSRSLPHARGGVSGIRVTGSGLAESSPRTWGCFHPASLVLPHAKVFPMHVGVFPVLFRKFRRRICLPHARGGVSRVLCGCRCTSASSPRTWGCFYREVSRAGEILVFPTHVGVFPLLSPLAHQHRSLPHARGGVSANQFPGNMNDGSSPRTWGCFQ